MDVVLKGYRYPLALSTGAVRWAAQNPYQPVHTKERAPRVTYTSPVRGNSGPVLERAGLQHIEPVWGICHVCNSR